MCLEEFYIIDPPIQDVESEFFGLIRTVDRPATLEEISTQELILKKQVDFLAYLHSVPLKSSSSKPISQRKRLHNYYVEASQKFPKK